jgi:hypothetical protein
MEEKYKKFLSDANKAGYEINILSKNDKFEGWICHDSWVTNNLYAARALPQFHGYSIENILDHIMDYLHYKP